VAAEEDRPSEGEGMTKDPITVLQQFLSAESHKRLAEREIAWENPIDQNHAGYRKLMEMHHRLMRDALEDARKIVAAHNDPLSFKLFQIRRRLSASWLPRGYGAWRAYCGSGWRFLQLWRLRLAVRWSYD
jgi:hypothetical protein